MSFTDIRRDGLIAGLPASWRPYALLMRLDRPIGWWLLLLPGWWSIVLAGGGFNTLTFHHWYMMLLFLIGAIVMRGAGCVVNDLWDRDLDAKVERTRARPLASGAVKPRQAVALLAALCLAGLACLVQMGGVSIGLGVFSLLLVAAYPLMKRITWWPQAFLGLTFNFGALMGWSAATGGLGLVPALIYIAAFFWTLGYDTVYAHQDKDDDRMAGIKSTALLFGARSKIYIAAFYGVSWGLLLLCDFLLSASILSLGLMALPGVHMILQVMLWNPDSQASSLRVFKSNRDCGMLFFLSFLCS